MPFDATFWPTEQTTQPTTLHRPDHPALVTTKQTTVIQAIRPTLATAVLAAVRPTDLEAYHATVAAALQPAVRRAFETTD